MQKSSWEDKDEPYKQGWVRSGQKQGHYNHSSNPSRKPTGRRRITPAEQAWNQKLTGQFEATSRIEVLLTFKKAASELGINDAVCRFIDLLCCWTKPVDWRENGWPLVWPSNETLCEHLGFDERKLQRVRSRAIDAGLIRMRESRDNKRWGKRRNNSPDDIIVEGCGYDLSPLAERKAEFLSLIKEAEARRKQRGVLRRACSAWRRNILGLVDYGLQQGYDEVRWLSLANEARSIAGKAYRVQEIRSLLELELTLQKLHEQAELAIKLEERWEKEADQSGIRENNDVSISMNMSCAGDKTDGLYTTTTYKTISKANTKEALTGNAQENERSQFEIRTLPNGKDQRKIQTESSKALDQDVLNGFIVTPSLILKMAPAFRDWVSQKSASWQKLEEVIPHVLRHLGINKHAWGQACLVFGKQKAISVIAVIEARHTMGLVRKPGGLLRAFVELHQRKELHLDKTLFGLLDTISTVAQ